MRADTDLTKNTPQDADEIVDDLEDEERKSGGLKPLQKNGTGGLTAIQVARRLGMSVPWVKLHTPELRGRKTKQGYRYPANITAEKVREVLNFKAYKTNQRVAPTKDAVASETARTIFAELRKGTTTAQIVERFGYHPKVVREYAAEWVRCGQFDNHDFAIIHGRRQPDAPAPVMVNPPAATEAARPPSEVPVEQITPAGRPSVTERLAALRHELETSEGETK